MSTPAGYIRAGFMWAPGSQYTVDCDTVARELERIEHETGGYGTADEAMIVRAMMPDSSLYTLMEHHDGTAAHAWRREQMRKILRSIRIRYVNPRTEDEIAGPRAYQPVRVFNGSKDQPGVYIRVMTAATPAPSPPPTSFVVRTVQQSDMPPMVHESWLRSSAPSHPAPQPAAPAEPPERYERMSAARERARTVLLRWADTLEPDPYFASVVAAIRALD